MAMENTRTAMVRDFAVSHISTCPCFPVALSRVVGRGGAEGVGRGMVPFFAIEEVRVLERARWRGEWKLRLCACEALVAGVVGWLHGAGGCVIGDHAAVEEWFGGWEMGGISTYMYIYIERVIEVGYERRGSLICGFELRWLLEFERLYWEEYGRG